MNSTYFLGANTKDGFYSLYDGFCSADGDFLTVIKGGPGTGKSGFMRKIGECAEAHGLDAEYVACSGDPDSLDGVYIPALRRGWADGTAPHVLDPRRFGITGDYLNIGDFIRAPLSGRVMSCANHIYESYQGEYAAAYAYISAAGELRTAYAPRLFGNDELSALRRRIRGILRRQHAAGVATAPARRFMHALSCKGEIYLSDEITKLCRLVYIFDNGLGGAGEALMIANEEAEAIGAERVICHDPIDPSRIDALLLPKASLAFAADGYDIPDARHIRLDAMLSASALRPYRAEIKEGRRLSERAVGMALEHLRRAKALHDELEECYKAQMDFPALTEFTEKYIEGIF